MDRLRGESEERVSEFHVTVERLHSVQKHPNADTLSIGKVHDYPVIFRSGEFSEGDRVVYIPVDSLVPTERPEFSFLGEHKRIRAKKLRGIYSQGLIIRPANGEPEGADLAAALGITKYEPPEPQGIGTGGEDERDPGFMPVYTDIEGLRRWPDILREGESVILTEKIHGANARFCFRDGRLWVGSHKRIKREDAGTLWWKVAAKYELAARLAQCDGLVLYGEIYGQVQDLRYGSKPGEVFLRVFDAFDRGLGRYIDHGEFVAVSGHLGLDTPPILYAGPWSDGLRSVAEGQTAIGGAAHVREGFVVRPVHERYDDRIGRVILKMVGEGYLLRKWAA